MGRSELLNEGSGAASHHVCYISFLEAANGGVLWKKGILKNFTKFTRKNLRWNLSFNKVVSTRRISEICQICRADSTHCSSVSIVDFEQVNVGEERVIHTQIPKYDYCILQDVEKSSCYLKIWGISWKVYKKNKKKCFFIDTLHLWAGSMCIPFTVLQRVKKAISEKTINYPNFPQKVTSEKIFKWWC